MNENEQQVIFGHLRGLNHIAAEQLYREVRQHWEADMHLPRNQQEKRLLKFGLKGFSQNDEDGIIQEIIHRLGPALPKTFVEFGVEDGVECNTLRLLHMGWTGKWLEGSEKFCKKIEGTHAHLIGENRLRLLHTFVTKDNFNSLMSEAGYTDDKLGLLSIDIDSNDIWLWQALTVVRPAIVVIEYNASWAPPLSVAQPNDPNLTWKGTNYFGASLKALEKIGRSKGYNLVGCCYAGMNAFFVREDLCSDKFHAPYTAEEHYEPARYWMRFIRNGHPPQYGPLVEV
jgi:hypothetical protein